MINYGIRADYTINEIEKYCDTRNRQSLSQEEVYKFARIITNHFKINSIADVGCGCAFKLLKYFEEVDTIGYDVYQNIEWLKKVYPNREWQVSNTAMMPQSVDLVISADVIEHVLNPAELINWILKMDPKYIIISTPDRDKLVTKLNRAELGPPGNSLHIREWNYKEFNCFMNDYIEILMQRPIGNYGQLIFGRKRV